MGRTGSTHPEATAVDSKLAGADRSSGTFKGEQQDARSLVLLVTPAWKRGFSLTAEQLEASRAERMRQNGHGALTLEDARTWLEETGLCPFAPRRQFSTFTAPSFVEAVAGQRSHNPDPKHLALAEELLVRLERDDVAVRLNLLGQPGEQQDYVVASWVLPYVYALRGDRDWRRNPQLTGSRQVSPLAVQAYKLIEAGDASIPQLKHALGREVSEQAVVRAITELWQQLRIIPVVSDPGQPIRWQLLRLRFQKAIAEGASTSQVTAISVLASIYLQAVIAASMEEVELFLSPLTARSKVREVLRGLVATRQVHTIQFGHAPHFYVAGTLPEFSTPSTIYASAAVASTSYFAHSYDRPYDYPYHHVDEAPEPAGRDSAPDPAEAAPLQAAEARPHRSAPPRKPAPTQKPAAARPHFSRPAAHPRDRKPAQTSSNSRPARRAGSEARTQGARPAAARAASGSPRWNTNGAKNGHGNGAHNGNGAANGVRSNGNGNARASRPAGATAARDNRNGSHPASWTKRNGHSGKPASTSNGSAHARNGSSPRKDSRADARGSSRKPALTAGAKAGNNRRYGFTAPRKQETKKRG
jgi:hypothetical protein